MCLCSCVPLAVSSESCSLHAIACAVAFRSPPASVLACRSLSSKVVSQYSAIFAPMAVDAVLRVLDTKQAHMLDLKNIKIVTKVGGTIDDSELVTGMVFDQKASKAAGGPTRVEKAKIGLIQVRACVCAHVAVTGVHCDCTVKDCLHGKLCTCASDHCTCKLGYIHGYACVRGRDGSPPPVTADAHSCKFTSVQAAHSTHCHC